jgi:hypothetical protein
MISKDQILEWVDNPVTLALKELCSQEYNNALSVLVSDCLCRGEPQKTQEQVLENNTKILEWETFVSLLGGNFQELRDLDKFSQLVEEDDGDSDEDESE